jgi:hypothetical protein
VAGGADREKRCELEFDRLGRPYRDGHIQAMRSI